MLHPSSFGHFYQVAEEDHFRAGVAKDAPVAAIVDSRVQALSEMGVDGADAEHALEVSPRVR